MIFVVIGVAVLFIGAIVWDRFLPASPITNENFAVTREYWELLEEDLIHERIELKEILIPPSYVPSPFNHPIHKRNRTTITVFGMPVVTDNNTRELLRKCLVSKNGTDYEVWCRLRIRGGDVKQVDWIGL